MQTALALINFGALVLAIIELLSQRRDTQQLAQLTSELDDRVHRLATNLDQKIFRLTRVRDLINGLMQVSVALRQKSRPQADRLNHAIQREMTFPELGALIYIIGDEEMTKEYQQLGIILGNEIWPRMWNELDYDIGEADYLLKEQSTCIASMHRRILALLEETTGVK